MGFFGDYLGDRKYMNLAAKPELKNYSRPKSVEDNSYLNRYSKTTVQNLFLNDWFTFATVNTCSNTFSKPKSNIIAKNPKSVKLWADFFDNMRLYGSNTSVRRLRAELKRDAVSYGAGYLEYVYGIDNSKEILDLKRVDAAIIEHAKDKKGHLILDWQGNSIGYVLHLGANKDPKSKGDAYPQEYTGVININNGDIFLNPERIAEFPLYKLGNDTESLGVIEPAIQQAQRRMKLETAQVNAIWIRGTSPLFTYVGDTTHEPTPQMMEDAVDAITELRHSQAMAFPYYNKVDKVDIKTDPSIENVMDNLMYGEAGAAGIPLPFVTGQGEATNRSTLATQKELFEANIQEKIENFDEDWNNTVMRKVAESNDLPEAKMISEELRLESKDTIATRLVDYMGSGLLSVEEARNILFKYEDFERDDKSFEKFVKDNEKKQKAIMKQEKDVAKEKDTSKKKDDSDDDTTDKE